MTAVLERVALDTTSAECPFCNYMGPILGAFESCYVIEPLRPVVPGHLLVIPYEHFSDVHADPRLAGECMKVAAQMRLPPFNIITSAGGDATQTVMHMHLHVVPRRAGDGLRLPWSE